MRLARRLTYSILLLLVALLTLHGCSGGGAGSSSGISSADPRSTPSSLTPVPSASSPTVPSRPVPKTASRFSVLQTIPVIASAKKANATTSIGPLALGYGDFDGDGHLDLVTADGTEATASVLLGHGDGTFSAPVKTALTAGKATALVVDDIDGDLKPDVAVTTSPSDTSAGLVTVLFGDGHGGFDAQTTIETGKNPVSIATATISAGAGPDLVVVERGDARASWFANLGGRSFGSGNIFYTGQDPCFVRGFRSVMPAFVVLDARADTALWYSTPNSGAPAAPVAVPTGREPVSATLLDINVDDKLELLITCHRGSTLAYHAISSGEPDPSPSWTYHLMNAPGALAYRPADKFMGHFMIPLIVCPDDDAFYSPTRNDGYENNAFTFSTGRAPCDIIEADFNEDGFADCVVANSASGTLSIGLGMENSDHSLVFRATRYIAGGVKPSCGVAGNFDGDGRPDIASSDESSACVNVFLSTAADRSATLFPAWFQSPVPYSVGAGPVQIATCSLRNNGITDLVVTCRDANTVVVLRGDGSGGFTADAVPVANGPVFTALGDVNRDGLIDAVVACKRAGQYQVLINNGLGSFSAQPAVDIGANPQVLGLGDLNKDGILDVAVGSGVETLPSAGQAWYMEGAGDGTFKPPTEIFEYYDEGGVTALAVGDILVSDPTEPGQPPAGSVPNVVMIRRGDLVTTYPTDWGISYRSLATDVIKRPYRDLSLVDLNNDTIPDKIFVEDDLGAVAAVTSTGTLRDFPDYAAPPLIPCGHGARSARATDLNGDGRPDLLVVTQDGIVVVPQQ